MRSCFPLMIVFIILVFVGGCSALQKAQGYYDLCRNDAECVRQMQEVEKGVSAVGAGFSVLPGGDNILGLAIGSLASLFAGVLYGKRLSKKKV